MAKILVVDDDPVSREALFSLLTRAGYECLGVVCGGQALEAVPVFRPDLIILDLMMPGINGWEFLDARAKSVFSAAVPVIVFSAYGDVPQPLPGVSLVVGKPADPDMVLDAVSGVLVGEMGGKPS